MEARTAQWLSVPVALAAVVASLGVAAWILAAGDSSEPAAAAATPGQGRVLRVAERQGRVLFALAVGSGGGLEVRAWKGSSPVPASRISVAGVVLERVRSGCSGACVLAGTAAFRGTPLPLTVSTPSGATTVSRRFVLPPAFPPSADRLLAAAKQRMRGLRSVELAETLSNGPETLQSRWQMVAPDRLRIVSSDGNSVVQIGDRRWSRVNGRWDASEGSPTKLPAYIWDNARAATLTAASDRNGLTVVNAFDPQAGPAWYRLFIGRDRVIRRALMLGPAHFMVDRVTTINRPLRIEPPQ